MNTTWKDVMKFELKETPIIFDLGGYLGVNYLIKRSLIDLKIIKK